MFSKRAPNKPIHSFLLLSCLPSQDIKHAKKDFDVSDLGIHNHDHMSS